MRIAQLELRNMRLFGNEGVSVDFSLGKNVTILLGNNGCGKTSLLDAIAFLLDPYTAFFSSRSRGFSLQDTDVHLTDRGRLAPYLSLSATFRCGADNAAVPVFRNRKGLV